MPKRSPLGSHIVRAVDRARNTDPSLTIRAAAKELGISESSYYKLRAGTRPGSGRIAKQMRKDPQRASGQKQSTHGGFTVTFTTADGSRTATRNVNFSDMGDNADSLRIQHDVRRMKRAIQQQLAAEAKDAKRRDTGSPPWSRKDRDQLVVTKIEPRVYGYAPAFLISQSDYRR